MDLNELTFNFFIGFHVQAMKEQLDHRIETRDYVTVDMNNMPIFYYLPEKDGKFKRVDDGILVYKVILFSQEAMINDNAVIQCKSCKWVGSVIVQDGDNFTVPYSTAVYLYTEQCNRISELFRSGYKQLKGVTLLDEVFSKAFLKLL